MSLEGPGRVHRALGLRRRLRLRAAAPLATDDDEDDDDDDGGGGDGDDAAAAAAPAGDEEAQQQQQLQRPDSPHDMATDDDEAVGDTPQLVGTGVFAGRRTATGCCDAGGRRRSPHRRWKWAVLETPPGPVGARRELSFGAS